MKDFARFIFSFIGLRSKLEVQLGGDLKDDELCCVCLSRLLKGGEDIRVLPCSHELHSHCVDRWFSLCSRTCPICRYLVEDDHNSFDKDAMTEDMVSWFSSFHVAGF
ncbi:hypothetical protein Nepgr_008415 [Nepenthes gracilis]|uniref:RING-type E3 ubiquitin transferase n=1 Tax=Nepenthes gracilis TaxID=150966 RepID=A0AAD3S8P5_NEPGR|nr:hypothetical protein Nepgr_008415 [Nepenthes gracilis]